MTEIKTIEVAGLRLVVRHMTSEDIGQLIALTSSVSWQLTLDDAKIMHQADPDGFIGAFLDDGTLICHFSLNKCDEHLAYLGLYLTSFPYRGRGIGDKMLRHAIEIAGKRVLALDSAPANVRFYERYGFKSADFTLIRVLGTVDLRSPNDGEIADVSVKKVTSETVEAVLEFDRQMLRVNRSGFVKRWLLSGNSVSRYAVDRDARIAGYIVIRPDHVTASPNFFKVVGLHARTITAAGELLREALRELPEKSRVWGQFPHKNETSAMLVYKKFGMDTIVKNWELRKLVRGGEYPALNWSCIYSVTNPCNIFI